MTRRTGCLGSGRQGPELMRCKFSFRQLSGFGRIAYPRPGEATTQALPGCKSHCCSARGRSDQSGEQICGSEQKRMLQSPEMVLVLKSLYGYRGNADPLRHWGRPTFHWEATDTRTSGTHRDMEPDTQRKFSGDKVGKIHRPAGADSNLRRPDELGTTEVARRAMVRRMSQYEQGRTGNAVPDGDKSSPRQWLAEAKRLSAHDGQPPSHLRDCEPSPGRDANGRRVGCITRWDTGACVSALNPVADIVEGQSRTGPLGLCIRAANRTREIRPSGMTTGARGIVRHGSRIEAQREIAGSATGPCRSMRHESIQTIGHVRVCGGAVRGTGGPTRQNALRPQVIIRKNSFFNGSKDTAQFHVIMTSVITTLQRNGINPRTWMMEYLQHCALAGGKAPADVAGFLPWNAKSKELKRWSKPDPPQQWPMHGQPDGGSS